MKRTTYALIALLLAAAWWVVLASERIIEVARVGYTISA